MTKDKNFKRVVRSRMADSGEPYTATRERLQNQEPVETPRRILGVEHRSVGAAASSDYRELSAEEVARYLFRRVVSWGRSTNVFLTNGARMYLLDGRVMEYATPECDSARQLTAHGAAGEAILASLAVASSQRLTDNDVPVSIRILVDGGPSGGCHENYSVAKKVSARELGELLVPFLVARQLLTGAGAVLPSTSGNGFALSRRSEHVWRRFGEPNSDWGYLTDTLTDPDGSHLRLHLSCGDTNRAEPASFMKAGTTALVLRTIEERPDLLARNRLALENGIRSLREVSHDHRGRQPLPLAHGGNTSALALLGHYLDGARGLLETGTASPEERRVLRQWDQTLALVDAGETEQLARRCDWAAKLLAVQDEGGLQSPNARLLDASYSQISPHGLFDQLVAAERIDRVCTHNEVTDAQGSPPETTRARLRGSFITTAIAARSDYTVDWRHLKLSDQPQRTLLLNDPFQAEDPRVDRLLADLEP